jgi:hypothetical protein
MWDPAFYLALKLLRPGRGESSACGRLSRRGPVAARRGRSAACHGPARPLQVFARGRGDSEAQSFPDPGSSIREAIFRSKAAELDPGLAQ